MRITLYSSIDQIDITPPTGAYLGGFAGRTDPSTGAYHPLKAVAFAIDDGEMPVLILAAEWLGFYDRTDRVRQQISQVTGIPESQIVLSASHTHCGPAMWKYEQVRNEPINQKYTDQAIGDMVDCALSAWQSRKPAVIRVGNGQCDLAICRRFPDPDNLPHVLRAMTPYPQGYTDHNVPMITIHHLDGELRGVLYSYACHPTSRGGLQFGGDYVAFATDRIEQEHPGVTAAFLQGCGGDQKVRPADPQAESFGQRTIDQVRDAGYQLGDAVNTAIKQNDFQKVQGSINITQKMLELQTEPLNDELIQDNLTGQHEYQQQWAQYQLDQIKKGEPVSTAVDFELQTICFGHDLVIITMAGEMSVEYSLRLKRELDSDFSCVLPLGYTNSIVGYVPVKRQIPELGYEVWDANQYEHLAGPYIAQTEQQIVDAIHFALH